MVDFLNNPIAEFNELRIAFFNLVTAKAATITESVLTFVSNHSSELLYGSLSVFTLSTFAYLLLKLSNAVYERDGYKWESERANRWENFWRSAYNEEVNKVIDLEGAMSDFHDERRKMQDVINTLREERNGFEVDMHEAREERDHFEERADYWEMRCDDANSEREEAESDRDDWENRYDNAQAEICELEEKIELLQQMASTYKELVEELETPQLRLAA